MLMRSLHAGISAVLCMLWSVHAVVSAVHAGISALLRMLWSVLAVHAVVSACCACCGQCLLCMLWSELQMSMGDRSYVQHC